MKYYFRSNILIKLALLVVLLGFSSNNFADSNFINTLSSIDFEGFLEARAGVRTQEDSKQKDMSMAEVRLQIGSEQDIGDAILAWKTDIIADAITGSDRLNLETGDGFMDLRLLNLSFSPTDIVDIKVGRQILTWGTGDMVFINDLFPKDYPSFFIGRNDEYLKAPSDAIKVSIFTDLINTNMVFIPRFDSDRFVSGDRISFYDPVNKEFRGRHGPIQINKPVNWFKDGELAFRFYQIVNTTEIAFYYYRGFWKSPAGFDEPSNKQFFPKLQTFGASSRAPFFGGISHIEFGYYRSKEDAKTNAMSRNSEFRFLLGFEREVGKELTAGVQYNLERKLNYDDYIKRLPNDFRVDSENQHIMTLRLGKLFFHQNLNLSLFNFYSLTNKDGYLRLNVSYKVTDNLTIETGGNIFYGQKDETFYGQFKHNNNIYSALRYIY